MTRRCLFLPLALAAALAPAALASAALAQPAALERSSDLRRVHEGCAGVVRQAASQGKAASHAGLRAYLVQYHACMRRSLSASTPR
jgi:hypothetical protein